MRYWLQVQSAAGNWVDSLGTDSLDSAVEHGKFLRERGETVRVVFRVDTVIWSPDKDKEA